MAKLTLQDLEANLWKAADILRGELNAAQYKDYIFNLLFLKRMNDEFQVERETKRQQFLNQGMTAQEVEERLEDPQVYVSFFVPKQARWDNLKNLNLNIGSELEKAFKTIENEPKNDELIGVLTTTNFKDKERVSDKKLSQLLLLFDSMQLDADNLESSDMLGDAYQYLIKKFADEGGSKGGEFYTPSEVVQVLVNILKPQEGDRIYDPTAGSGGMLIKSIEYVRQQGGNPRNLSLFGQEINLSTWAICKMNMIFHNANGADIRKGDTIRNPMHLEGEVLKKFDKVLANPPFSMKNWGYEEAKADPYHRFVYGVPPQNFGDLAFVSHMVASLNAKGKMGTVVPHGVLFRGGAEGKIRKGFVNDDLIEAVIGLPNNIFYGTSIPAALLIINKNKPQDRKGKVLFVEASKGFVKNGNKNKLRDEDVKAITKAFDEFKEQPKFSAVVSLNAIKENDYNLNISRYVDTSQEEEEIDIEQVLQDIRYLKMDIADTEEKLNGYLAELGFEGI